MSAAVSNGNYFSFAIRYENLLITLLQEIIKKLQTKVDDDEDEEEIFECTEVLQNLYLNNHANVIDLLAELIPEKTFAYVVSIYIYVGAKLVQVLIALAFVPSIYKRFWRSRSIVSPRHPYLYIA